MNVNTVDLIAPDISPYRAGNTGIDYATTFDSGVPGSHVMVSAVVHGNEICGAIALDWLFRHDIRPQKGRLTLIFMNVAAFLAFDPATPTTTRFVDEDFNRVWDRETLDGARSSAELRRAREVRPLVDQTDFLLDIHSMQRSCDPLMLAGVLSKGRTLAEGVGVPEHIIMDAGHRAGRRMRDYGSFSDPKSAKASLLVECGQHWEKRSEVVAIETMLRFLVYTGCVSEETAAPHLGPPVKPQRVVDVSGPVTIQSDRFQFVQEFQGLEVIKKAGTVIGYDGDAPVKTPYDDCVLIMPTRRTVNQKGTSAVRLGRFVA